jgi:hypothetical protein
LPTPPGSRGPDPIPQLPPVPNVPGNPVAPLLPGGVTGAGGGLGGMVLSASRLITGAIARTWLSAPQLTDQGRIKQLWQASLTITLVVFVVFIVAGGVVVMTHESVQTRYALRQIAPRVAAGFLAACLSLQLIGQAIGVSNALAQALLGQGFDIAGAITGLVGLLVVPAVTNPLAGGLVFLILALIGLVLLVALVATFIIRLVVTTLLIVSAPLALACHASPATEGAAFMWWRLLVAVLAIQAGQALGLITALRVFSNTGGRQAAGIAGGDPLINAVVVLCLLYVLVKIPVWAFRLALQRTGRHTPLLVRIAAYTAASRIFRGARGMGRAAGMAGSVAAGGTAAGSGWLPGLGKAAAGLAGRGGPGRRGSVRVPRAGQGAGPAPAGTVFRIPRRRGPEPSPSPRRTRTSPPRGVSPGGSAPSTAAGSGAAAGRGVQLALPIPVRRAPGTSRWVQSALPIRAERAPRTPRQRQAPPPLPRSSPRARGRQLMLPGMPRRPTRPRQLVLPLNPPPHGTAEGVSGDGRDAPQRSDRTDRTRR